MASKEYYRNRRKQQKDKAISMLGGKCVKCGSSDRLQFDHIIAKVNGGKKNRNVSDMLHYKWKTLEAELKLCQLLCFECHVLKSMDDLPDNFPNKKGNISHGISCSIKKKCNCGICKDTRKRYNKKRRDVRLAERIKGTGLQTQLGGFDPRAVLQNKLPRGVSYYHRDKTKYRASTTVNYKRIHLGIFDTIEQAQKAYIDFNKSINRDIDTDVIYYNKSNI